MLHSECLCFFTAKNAEGIHAEKIEREGQMKDITFATSAKNPVSSAVKFSLPLIFFTAKNAEGLHAEKSEREVQMEDIPFAPPAKNSVPSAVKFSLRFIFLTQRTRRKYTRSAQ